MINKCPGQDDKNLKPEILHCPGCGYEIEIFSDEIRVRCPRCKILACRDRLPSCINWCKSARECTGDITKSKKGGR